MRAEAPNVKTQITNGKLLININSCTVRASSAGCSGFCSCTKHYEKAYPQTKKTGVVGLQLLWKSFIQNDVKVVTETDFSCLPDMSSDLYTVY